MIIIVCIEIFVVSTMFLQRVINESPMKKQWNFKVSELNTFRTKKIRKVSSKLSLFPIYLSKASSTIIDEAAMKHQCFGDYHTKKVYHYCLHWNHQSLSNVSSKNHQQWLINQAAMKHQKLKYSTLKTLLIKNVCVQRFVVSSMVLQRVINESSK